MRTILNSTDKEKIIFRFKELSVQSPCSSGDMSVHQMVVHLIADLHYSLGDTDHNPVPTTLRLPPLIRHVVLYWLPWPNAKLGSTLGNITGQMVGEEGGASYADVDTLNSAKFESDVANLIHLIECLSNREPNEQLPINGPFGSMSVRDWGVYHYKHFNLHLCQFGV